MSFDVLRKVPLFSGLSDTDLAVLSRISERVGLEAGSELFHEGSEGDRAYVLLSGELEILKSSGGRPVLLALRSKPGDLIGEMALLEQIPRMATVRARASSELLAIGQQEFDTLLASSPHASRVMFRTVVSRWRETEAMLHQSEKMAQLGTLTSGVAHELNNPAAAIMRSVAQARESLRAYIAAGCPASTTPLRARLAAQAARGAERTEVLDTLSRSDREAELSGWLEGHGLRGSPELPSALLGMGYDPPALAALAAELPRAELGPILAWLEATYSLHLLIRETGEAAGRIAGIVKALRSYSFLDQAPLQSVDVHEGLENTLLLMAHKLGKGIRLVREYEAGLPAIEAYGSELNQVWTNLIDNAADALQGHGRITIRSRREAEWVVLEIEDDGPGIPPEARERVFDAFYTTKPPGQGTGLGLHLSYGIVVRRHLGDIRLTSSPGRTCFQVRLPIRRPRDDRLPGVAGESILP